MRLEAEWRLLAERRGIAERAAVERWPAEAARMAAAQSRLEQAGEWLSGPRDLLSVVGLHRWERAHSAALAWLLDPQGGHGLRDAFLLRFLARAGLRPPPGAPGRVEVTCETDAGNAPVDVLVRGDGWTVVVEVKVGAGEQERQAWRLWGDWRGEPEVRFVYLTPNGRGTTTHETEECRRAWAPVRWSEVAADLRSGLREHAGGPARPAAEQYSMTLQALFGRRS